VANKKLIRNLVERKPEGKLKGKWDDSIKMYLKGIRCKDVVWI
jgi:hypothetical protein